MRDILLSLSCAAAVGLLIIAHAHDAPVAPGDGMVAVLSLAETLAAHDEHRLVHLFTDDALVLGERAYHGREEIRDWARAMLSADARLDIHSCPAVSAAQQGMLTWRGRLVGRPGAHLPSATAFAARLSEAGDAATFAVLVIAPTLSPLPGGPEEKPTSGGCQASATVPFPVTIAAPEEAGRSGPDGGRQGSGGVPPTCC